MYFINFFFKIFLIKFLKKKSVIEYKINAPNEIDIKDISVPIHFPNIIPETIVRGDPKPSKAIQIIENIEK